MPRFSVLICTCAVALAAAGCGQFDTVTNRNVKAKLLDASQQTRQVYVMTRDGVVTLSGTVESAQAKELAVRLARETKGVTDVIDLIDVEVGAGPRRRARSVSTLPRDPGPGARLPRLARPAGERDVGDAPALPMSWYRQFRVSHERHTRPFVAVHGEPGG